MTKIISISFYILFFFTPLFWTSFNFELFEYNKMMLIYLLTIIIATGWLIKMIQTKTFIFKKTPLDIPLMLFLLANILSTIFSIDRHTSIWGYYSRSNGGLLSVISYILLYYALVANFDKDQVLKFLKAAIFGGVIVALYAIPEHFGISPSCVVLTGELNATCWVQDVQARVFATLGQPNWLAAYLAMLIFPTIYFFQNSKTRILHTTYYILLFVFYLAFTFTYSRGATLGLLAGLAVFMLFLSFQNRSNLSHLRGVISIIISFLAINLIFGSALTDFKLLDKFAPPSRPSITQATAKPSGTQLENGGTESGQIRLIVWQGAVDIFKHYPIVGSGVETFAYSYYGFRPASHNLVSEWDFLYNKAHNEYLNYLATTGLVGFLSYMAIILTFTIWSIKYYVSSIKQKNHTTYYILHTTLLASYISYLVQNFFGFSVVITALFFFLFPAIAFVLSDSLKPFQLTKQFHPPSSILYPLKHPTMLIIIIALISGYFAFTISKYYLADIFFTTGERISSNQPIKSYKDLSMATYLNPDEPYYKSELAFTSALASVTLADTDATLSAQLKDQANLQTEQILKTHPKNVPFFRTAIRTYFLLSSLDKNISEKTLQTFDAIITLAPTDAKLYYNKAVVLEAMGRKEEAIQLLQTTLQLKPNYLEAKEALDKLSAKN